MSERRGPWPEDQNTVGGLEAQPLARVASCGAASQARNFQNEASDGRLRHLFGLCRLHGFRADGRYRGQEQLPVRRTFRFDFDSQRLAVVRLVIEEMLHALRERRIAGYDGY